ncbi:uncharacterized protein LOC135184495 [Pogoniulus pusillus]|uniref:uncharacterized protein LOC135184495 n=1 Tax=Pogoniulus pusillus TaxID=488313 RepID=UPI0030B9696F
MEVAALTQLCSWVLLTSGSPWRHHADVPVAQGSPASQMDSRTEALADGMDVPSQTKLLEPSQDRRPLQPGWLVRGPPGAALPAEAGKPSIKAEKALRKLLQRVHWQADEAGGLPTSAPDELDLGVETEPTEHVSTEPSIPLERLKELLEELQRGRGLADERTADAGSDKTPHRTECPQQVLHDCMVAMASIAVAVPATLLVCYLVLMRRRKTRKEAKAAAAAEQDQLRSRDQPGSPSQRQAPQLHSAPAPQPPNSPSFRSPLLPTAQPDEQPQSALRQPPDPYADRTPPARPRSAEFPPLSPPASRDPTSKPLPPPPRPPRPPPPPPPLRRL